MFTDFCKLVQD